VTNTNTRTSIRDYREILYGLAFGLSAWLIDAVMHAWTENRSFWDELIQPGIATVAYRALFVAFGLALGWSLWQKSRRERDFRRLTALLGDFQREISGPAFLLHSKLQLLLIKEDLQCSAQTQELIRSLHVEVNRIQTLVKEKLPTAERLDEANRKLTP